MKTATVRELRNEYKRVLGWAEAGEEVAISRRGKIIARLVPEKPKSKRVDWTKSAAFALHEKWKNKRKLTAEESAHYRCKARRYIRSFGTHPRLACSRNCCRHRPSKFLAPLRFSCTLSTP